MATLTQIAAKLTRRLDDARDQVDKERANIARLASSPDVTRLAEGLTGSIERMNEAEARAEALAWSLAHLVSDPSVRFGPAKLASKLNTKVVRIATEAPGSSSCPITNALRSAGSRAAAKAWAELAEMLSDEIDAWTTPGTRWTRNGRTSPAWPEETLVALKRAGYEL